MTLAQRKGLLVAAANGGKIRFGQGVRKDVIERLWSNGYLELRCAGMTEDEWVMTTEGKAVAQPYFP